MALTARQEGIVRQIEEAMDAVGVVVSLTPFMTELLDWSKNGLPAGQTLTEAQVRKIIADAIANG